MMEKDKYRGKVLHNGNHFHSGKWVHGSLIKKSSGVFIYVIEKDSLGNIIRETEVEVDSETVGQCLGIQYKNGEWIYQGDRMTKNEYPMQDEGQRNYDAIVHWFEANCGFGYSLELFNKSKRGISEGMTYEFSEEYNLITDWEKLGTIYDKKSHPEGCDPENGKCIDIHCSCDYK